MTVYWNGVETRSPMRSLRGRSRSCRIISSEVAASGTPKKGTERVRGGIGIGDREVSKVLSEFMIGDLGLEMDSVPVNGAGGVNEEWVGLVVLSNGSVVGDGIPKLMGAGDEGEVISAFCVYVCAEREEIWRWGGHEMLSSLSIWRVFILFTFLNSAKSSGA